MGINLKTDPNSWSKWKVLLVIIRNKKKFTEQAQVQNFN